MIDPSNARVVALSSATEDYIGFYELVWELNAKYPTASDSEKLDAARSALGCLFEEALVEVFAARASPDSYEPIDQSRGAAIVADPASYVSPNDRSDRTYFAFAATAAGKREYYSLPPETFEQP